MARLLILAAIPFLVIPVAVMLTGGDPAADASWVLVALATALVLIGLPAFLRRRR
jgi:hypothetical protein